ncbi:4-diphosphocytidyl-2C-methyl-D-erythritol kinase [Sulfolobus acidocaldarius SUSAZ]|nr:4-diphosphocytidyl-2C-methyl-D-erythritol kinase [Sulfolobus acidocaldarius SUSAZ]
MKIGAIILAAGEGKRFGGNKLLATIDNTPIIIKTIDSVKFLDRVIIVGKYYKELLDVLSNEIVIYNPNWREGISSSIKLGVRFFFDFDGVLVLLGDMPLITENTVKKIVSEFKENCYAVIPVHKGTRGNPVLLSRVLYEKIMNLKGDVGARMILGELKKENICEVECGREVLIDVDTPADLTLLQHP